MLFGRLRNSSALSSATVADVTLSKKICQNVALWCVEARDDGTDKSVFGSGGAGLADWHVMPKSWQALSRKDRRERLELSQV